MILARSAVRFQRRKSLCGFQRKHNIWIWPGVVGRTCKGGSREGEEHKQKHRCVKDPHRHRGWSHGCGVQLPGRMGRDRWKRKRETAHLYSGAPENMWQNIVWEYRFIRECSMVCGGGGHSSCWEKTCFEFSSNPLWDFWLLDGPPIGPRSEPDNMVYFGLNSCQVRLVHCLKF